MAIVLSAIESHEHYRATQKLLLHINAEKRWSYLSEVASITIPCQVTLHLNCDHTSEMTFAVYLILVVAANSCMCESGKSGKSVVAVTTCM